jgi:AcrR family transcriptional regulator
MRKNPAQTAQTRAALKDAFWKLYAQKPIEQITVREIAQQAGYNRGTFYAYYKDVYDLIEQTEDEIFEGFTDGKRFASDPFDDAQTEAAIHYFVSFLERYRPCLPLLLEDRGDQKFFGRLKEQVRGELRTALGRYFVSEEHMVDYVIEYAINAQAALILRWFHNGCDIPLEDIVRLARELMHHGIFNLLRPGGQQRETTPSDGGKIV